SPFRTGVACGTKPFARRTRTISEGGITGPSPATGPAGSGAGCANAALDATHITTAQAADLMDTGLLPLLTSPPSLVANHSLEYGGAGAVIEHYPEKWFPVSRLREARGNILQFA